MDVGDACAAHRNQPRDIVPVGALRVESLNHCNYKTSEWLARI